MAAHTCRPSDKPSLELADIFRTYGESYRQCHRLSGQQLKAMAAIEACRTPVLGSQTAVCDQCGEQVVRYHSCGNRHCPKCQTLAKVRWVEARSAELLNVPYFHGVFTLPHELGALAWGNPQVCYTRLFQSTADTLRTFGHDPKWLGGDLGITMVLHTWNQLLQPHLHVHCIITGGALSPDQTQWIETKRRDFLFPVRALAKVFRAKYLDALDQAFRRDQLTFTGRLARLDTTQAFKPWLDQFRTQDWVVYAKAPLDGPQQVVSYLGRYTHRVALSNDRLVALQDDQVHFKWRDSRHGNTIKVAAVSAHEFIRRFLLHILPKGFVRIRHSGVLGNRGRQQRLIICRRVLNQAMPAPRAPEAAAELMKRLTGIDIEQCPHCRTGRLRIMATVHTRVGERVVPQATGPP